MSRRGVSLTPLALLLLPSLVMAQPMMDPRQMSGIPRPDGQVPAGVLTVKVLSGSLSDWAPIGTPVHLVAMRGDELTLTTSKVNDEGRAEFTGLSTDGLTAYYALSIFGGDRLISQPAVLPPKVGIRMMLSGRKLDASKQPVGPAIDDEAEPDGHEGAAGAPAPPAAGEVEIMARGRVDGGEKVVLRELVSGETREAVLAGSGELLSARFTGLPRGPDRVYVAELPGKPVHRSSPFMLSDTAGARRMVLVVDQLLFAIQGGGQVEDERMWFQLQLTVANLSGAPVDTGPEGLLLPLPAGFRSASQPEENARFVLVDGQGLRYVGAVPPGQISTTVQFALPSEGGQVAFDMPAPLGMFQSQIAIEKGPGMKISTPAGDGASAPDLRRSDDGREYLLMAGLTIAPGERLRFDIVGLPIVSKWEGHLKLFVGMLVLALVGIAFAAAVRKAPQVIAPRPRDAAGTGGGSARKELKAQRERLYAELVALERARQAQKIDEHIFAAQRRSIMTRLVLVHRELDDLEGPPTAAS